MSVYELDLDEAIILQTSDVSTGDNSSVDLVLTNKNLIQINKGFFGGNKGYVKYPLEELRVLNGKANILIGKSRAGSKQMELYFTSFALKYRFNAPFLLNKWASAITKAHKDRMIEVEKSYKLPKVTIVDAIKGTLEDTIDKVSLARESRKKVTKCSKCGAELTGVKGEQVICSYCDNVVVIK